MIAQWTSLGPTSRYQGCAASDESRRSSAAPLQGGPQHLALAGFWVWGAGFRGLGLRAV